MKSSRPEWLTDELVQEAAKLQNKIDQHHEEYEEDQWREFQIEHNLTDQQLERIAWRKFTE